jgi:hypothetical protein
MSLREPSPAVEKKTGNPCWSVTRGNQMGFEIEVYSEETGDRIFDSWGYGTGGYAKYADRIKWIPAEVYRDLFIKFENKPKDRW